MILKDLEEELDTLNDLKSELENELKKKKKGFSEIKKASDELMQKLIPEWEKSIRK